MQSNKVYCSLCGKDIKQCICKKPNPIETKVTTPQENKTATTNPTK